MKNAHIATLFGLLLTAVFAPRLSAQDSSMIAWVHQTGGKEADLDAAFAFDNQDHIYQVGIFSDTVDMDPGAGKTVLISSDATDVFLKKLNKKGEVLWALSFGGKGADGVNSLLFDSSGYLYIIGYFFDEIDLDPGPQAHLLKAVGKADAYICKLDTSGQFIWGKQLGGADNNYCTSLQQLHDKSLVLSGHFEGTVDFDPGKNLANKTSKGDFDSYLLRLDSAGSFQWVITQRSADEIICTETRVGRDQFIYTTGYFRDRGYFTPFSTPNLPAVQYTEGYIAKYDTSGNLTWVKHLSGQSHELCYGICLDSADNIYTTGMFEGELIIDRGSNQKRFEATNGMEAFVLKMDSSGSFSWFKALATIEGRTRGFNLAVDRWGNVYSAGTLSGTADFDPGTDEYRLTALSYYDDLYVHKLDKNGNFEWVKVMGSTQRELLYSLEVDRDGSVYTSGSFETTADFEPIPQTYQHEYTSAGLTDGFLLRINQCFHSQSHLTVTSCGPYQLPSASALIDSSGTFFDTLANHSGCDSFITIELKIATPSYDTMAATACNQYRLPSGSGWVYASGSFTDTLVNQAGCDSLLTINLDLQKSPEKKLKVSACKSYTVPSGNQTYFKSGTYFDTLVHTQGCDSVFEIELTIDQLDTSISKENHLLIANESDANYQWGYCDNQGFHEIQGATKRSLLVTQSGTYAVALSKGNCHDTSACTDVFTSVTAPSSSQVEVYPNPTQGRLTLKLSEYTTQGRVQVFNALGQLVVDQPFYNTDRVDTEITGSPGPHLVRLYVGNEPVYLMVMKR